MSKQVPPVDDDIYEYVQRHAVPLEDDFNSVLRRLLGMASESRRASASGSQQVGKIDAPQRQRIVVRKRTKTRAPKGSLLPEEAYELPILEALEEQGGRAPTSEIVDRVGEKLNGQLTDVDRQTLESGDIRWRNRVQFVRLALIKKGDLLEKSPRGVWELSDQGRQRVREHSS
jgi:hypothetical protein